MEKKNITIKHTTDNVTVYVSCFSYREELNKGIIIGEYVNELTKKYNYTDSIEIFLNMNFNRAPEYFFRNKKNIFLQVNSDTYKLLDNLKLIEYAILKKGKITEKVNYKEIVKSATSRQINEVLKFTVQRPKIVQELETKGDYSYYYKDSEYHVYNTRTKEVLFTTDTIYLFRTIAYSRPLIFVNNHEFYYKNLEGTLKFRSFARGNVLPESPIIKELDHFIVFKILENGYENLAILDIKAGKLNNNLKW